MMFRTNRALLGIALAAAAGLTACGGTADAATSAEGTGRPTGTPTTITVTVTPPAETTTVTPPAETTTVTETLTQPPRTRTVTRTRTRTATVTATETAVSDAAGDAASDSLVGSSGDDATGDDAGGSLYYANCSAARAAGDTPLFAGDPGYARHLDRDDDGVACE